MNSDELVYLSREPLNAETQLERQIGVITPASRHYVRDHFTIPQAPDRLSIDGAVPPRCSSSRATSDRCRRVRSW